MKLIVDNARHEANSDRDVITGIVVRAQTPSGRILNADIADLAKASRLEWLRSRGGDNPWAEDCVGILLGHGHLHPSK